MHVRRRGLGATPPIRHSRCGRVACPWTVCGGRGSAAGGEAWAKLAAYAELVGGDVGLVNGDGAGGSTDARRGFGPLRGGLDLGCGRGGCGVVARELGAGRERVVRVVGMV